MVSLPPLVALTHRELWPILSLDSTVAENQLKNGHQEGFPGLYSSQLGEIFRP